MGKKKTRTNQLTVAPRSGVSEKGSKRLGRPPGYDENGIMRKFWRDCKIKHGKYVWDLASNRAMAILFSNMGYKLEPIMKKTRKMVILHLPFNGADWKVETGVGLRLSRSGMGAISWIHDDSNRCFEPTCTISHFESEGWHWLSKSFQNSVLQTEQPSPVKVYAGWFYSTWSGLYHA